MNYELPQSQIERLLVAAALYSHETCAAVMKQNIDPELFSYEEPPGSKRYVYRGLFEIAALFWTKTHLTLLEQPAYTRDFLARAGIPAERIEQILARCANVLSDCGLDGATQFPHRVEYLVEALYASQAKRRLVLLPDAISQWRKELQGDPDHNVKLVERAIRYLSTALPPSSSLEEELHDLVREYGWQVAALSRLGQDEERPVPTGLDPIDEVMGGFFPGDLVIILGQVGRGKTLVQFNIAYNMVVLHNRNVLFCSLEMDQTEMMLRWNARYCGISYHRMRRGELTPEERQQLLQRISQRQREVQGSLWHATMRGEVTTDTIAERLERLQERGTPIDACFVDYLSLAEPSRRNRNMRRWERMTALSVELREMAETFGIPIITAVQYTREALRELRDSGLQGEVILDVDMMAEAVGIAHTADCIFALRSNLKTKRIRVENIKNREAMVPPFQLEVLPHLYTVRPVRQDTLVDELTAAIGPGADDDVTLQQNDYDLTAQ